MKHLRLNTLMILLATMALIAVGCKKGEEILNKLTQFSFETDYVVSVPASPIIVSTPIPVPTPDIQTHSDQIYSDNKTRADLVEEVRLTNLDLEVKNPVGGNLQFLKSIDIYARAEGLPDVRVAFKDLVPDNVGGTLSLDVTGNDLTEYFKKQTYQLLISVTTDQVVTENYEVNAHGKFFVDAKLLGQ